MKQFKNLPLYVLLGVVMFSVVAYHINERMRLTHESARYKEICRNLSDRMALYAEAIDYPLPTTQSLTDSTGRLVRIGDALQGSHLALYVDSRQCTSCWKGELERLKILRDSCPPSISPIVLANNFSPRELRIMRKETSFPVYGIENDMFFLNPLTKFNFPFFCVVENGERIRMPFYPMDKDMGEVPRMYFKRVSELCTAVEKENLSTGEKGLKLLNPNMELGTLKVRTQRTIRYQLVNKGDETCELYGCSPSCSCIVVDSFSTFIAPGDTGYVAISTVQTNRGDFAHSVNVSTSCRTMPYTLSFHGYCE